MKSWHFIIFFGPFLLPCTAQLYKQVTLPGNSWPSKIKRSAVGKTNVECGSLCSGDQVKNRLCIQFNMMSSNDNLVTLYLFLIDITLVRDWSPKFETGLNIIIGILQKLLK